MAIAEFRGECLMEFRPTSNGEWMFWGCHGPRNGPVALSTADAAAARCDALGILRPNEDAGGARAGAAIATSRARWTGIEVGVSCDRLESIEAHLDRLP